MLLQYLPPYIGKNNYTWSWRSDGIWQQGNEDIAIVYKTFDEDDVEDALDAMNKVTDILETDLGDADDDQGDDAGDTLKKRLLEARKYLVALLRQAPPGGVKLPKIKGQIRSDFAEMINEKQPGTVSNSEIQQRETTTTTTGNTDNGAAANGVPGADGVIQNNSVTLLNTTADSATSNGAPQTNSNSRDAVTTFEENQGIVSHNGEGGSIESETEQAYIPLALLQAGIDYKDIPGPNDTAQMNALLNSIGGNNTYPNTQMNTGTGGGGSHNSFQANNQQGYVAVIEGLGPLMIVQLSEADRKLLENRDMLQATFTQDLMASGMSQQQASAQAAHIVQSLQGYSGTSNSVYMNQNNTSSGTNTNHSSVHTGTNVSSGVNPNNNSTSNTTGNTTLTSNQRQQLKKESIEAIGQMKRYFNTLYPKDKVASTNSATIVQAWNMKASNSDKTVQQVLLNDANNLAQAISKANYGALLGNNHRNVAQLHSSIQRLQKLHAAYAQTSDATRQAQIVNEIKQSIASIHSNLGAVETAIARIG